MTTSFTEIQALAGNPHSLRRRCCTLFFYILRTIRSISKVLTPGSTASPANFKARDEILPASRIALSSRLVLTQP